MSSLDIAKKLPRPETTERHALRRAVVKSLRRLANGSGWGCNQGVLFRDACGWFVEVWTNVHVRGPRQLSLEMHVKPMALDPVFWEITQLQENSKLPLSFRALGAWTCRSESVFESRMPIDGSDSDAIARDILAWANSNLHAQRHQWELAGLIEAMRPNRYRRFAAFVSALIVDGRTAEAREACVEAEAAKETGGFVWSVLTPTGPLPSTFPAATRMYLDRNP